MSSSWLSVSTRQSQTKHQNQRGRRTETKEGGVKIVSIRAGNFALGSDGVHWESLGCRVYVGKAKGKEPQCQIFFSAPSKKESAPARNGYAVTLGKVFNFVLKKFVAHPNDPKRDFTRFNRHCGGAADCGNQIAVRKTYARNFDGDFHGIGGKWRGERDLNPRPTA